MKCIHSCPTQAIRRRNGKTIISEELCVDCGTCLSVCPSGAIIPISDPITEISSFKYKVVVPAAVLYSQFESNIHPYIPSIPFEFPFAFSLGLSCALDLLTICVQE